MIGTNELVTFSAKECNCGSGCAATQCMAQASLLLLDACADDAKSEVLHTKLFTLLLGERYRSHTDTLFTYRQGAWQMSPGGTLTAEDLEFLTMGLRRAQAYFAHPIDRFPMAPQNIKLDVLMRSACRQTAMSIMRYHEHVSDFQFLTTRTSCLQTKTLYFAIC